MRMIMSSFTKEVLALLNGSADVMAVVRESLSLGSQSLLTMVPALSDVLTEALTEKCVEVRFSFSLYLRCSLRHLKSLEHCVAPYPGVQHYLILYVTLLQVLKQAKGIIATYRMTNRPLPSRHSPYVTSVFQPLQVNKSFMLSRLTLVESIVSLQLMLFTLFGLLRLRPRN